MLVIRVQLPNEARDFPPRVNSQCRPSYAVFVQPSCAIACINICAHVKSPKHRQPYHCLDTWKDSKCWVNTQRWMWHPYGKGIENGHIYAICLPPTHPWKKMGYYLHEKREYEEVVSFSPSHSLHFILPPSPHPFLSPSLSPFPLLLRSSYYCSSHSPTPNYQHPSHIKFHPKTECQDIWQHKYA